jgi:hypothetical protein
MIRKTLAAAKFLRGQLAARADSDIEAIEFKERTFGQIEEHTRRLAYAADKLLASSWKPRKAAEQSRLFNEAVFEVEQRIRDVPVPELEAEARAAGEAVTMPRPLHWPLEFPEVFDRPERPGFDAIIGNPPFMGARRSPGRWGPTTATTWSSTWPAANGAAPTCVPTSSSVRGTCSATAAVSAWWRPTPSPRATPARSALNS